MKIWTLKDKKILIVDDFPAMRSMLRTILVSFGANNMKEAKNGEEAVEIIAQEALDIVLCDYNLGEGKNGQQVLEEAQERDLLPYSSIFIMSTAENTSEMVMGAVEYQPDDYLVKPFTRPVLQMRIRKLQDKKDGLKPISKAIESKDYQRALALCDSMLNTDQKNVFELLKLKADLLIRVSNHAQALKVYQQVLAVRDIPWALFGMGKVYYFLKQYLEAKNCFQQLLATNKNFVSAYDWLAKIESLEGDSRKSQEILLRAVAISPKAILRQKALAEVSFKNEDYDVSEKAYKAVLREGKNSVYKHPNDYGGLAKVYVKKDAAKDAAKVVDTMKKEFSDAAPQTLLQAAVIESLVCKDIGNEAQSQVALDNAVALFETDPGSLSSEVALQLAQACFASGKKEQGSTLMKHVVRNNHDNDDVLQQAQKLFSDLGMHEEGASIIAGTRAEVVEINNDGVALAKQGKLQESIALFVKAARAMPENVIINLNTAQSFIMYMQQSGVNEKLLGQTQMYLDRVYSVDSGNERFQKLLERYHDLAKKIA